MPIIPQTLNIYNSRTTRAKSVNLHTIRKLIEYSLKILAIEATFIPTVFEILMSKGRSVISPSQRGTGSERVNNFFFGNLLFVINDKLPLRKRTVTHD